MKRDKIKFLKEYQDKYVSHSHTCLGYYKKNEDGNYIDSCANVTIIPNKITDISRCSGYSKSLKVIKLTSLHIIRLAEEYKRVVEDIRGKISHYNETLKTDYVKITIEDSLSGVFEEIAYWDIYSNAARLAQLKVECPDIFSRLTDAITYIESKVNNQSNTGKYFKPYIDTWFFKEAEKSILAWAQGQDREKQIDCNIK